MKKTRSALLLVIVSGLVARSISAATDYAPSPTPAQKAEIDALPPVGRGLDMTRPYQQKTPERDRRKAGKTGHESEYRMPVPLSRDTAPPGYRYGSPGYTPDGRGGRGYDFGYPGYRDRGGGGYPHHRSFGTGRQIR